MRTKEGAIDIRKSRPLNRLWIRILSFVIRVAKQRQPAQRRTRGERVAKSLPPGMLDLAVTTLALRCGCVTAASSEQLGGG